mgnify:CR=1 FL=1
MFILVFVLVLCFFSGCQQNELELVDDRELSVFELKCSDKLKKAIRNSYYDWFETEHYCQVKREKWTDWEDTTDGVIQAYEPSHRYYGTFDGCVVWYWSEYPLVISDFQLAGSHFTYGSMDEFHVFTRNGGHYDLKEAYQMHMLSPEEIAIIAQRHNALREDYRNYGTYGKYQVWFTDNKEGEPTEFSLGDATFRHKEGAAFYVQKGGKQYTLQQAYEQGYLKDKHISQIATRHNERELSVLELSISDELKAQIETAYYTYVDQLHGGKAGDKVYDWVWTDFAAGQWGGYRYYGTFDDCVIWCTEGTATVVTELNIGGSYFQGQSANFNVLYQGKHYSLLYAYEHGLITPEDAAIILKRHIDYRNQVFNPFPYYPLSDDRDLSVFELSISDDMKMEAEYSFRQWYWPIFGESYDKEFIWDATAAENTLSCRYYGTFGKCIVWYAEEEPNLAKNFNIDQIQFQGASSANFHIYMDGEHITFEDAYYKECLLSEEDISLIAQRHAEYNDSLIETAGG